MSRAYRIVPAVLAIWLLAWIVLSWAAIQDDALIHLRFAANLLNTHHLTYDGVHPSYGASSLLYVYLLAILRAVLPSPNLPRAVSSAAHLLLFTGLALLFTRYLPRTATLARLLGLVLLVFLVSPSAIRWLDDGMETGLALCFVAALCWLTFRASRQPSITPSAWTGLVALGFFTVLLRTELLLLCALATLIIASSRVDRLRDAPIEGADTANPPLLIPAITAANHRSRLSSWASAALQSSHLLLGSLLALALILLTMHVLLPDTALAKSHGISVWKDVLGSSGHILLSALSFGLGLLVFWLLTLLLLVQSRQISPANLLANSVFPITLALATIRGQEIQGARYLIWTFFFSILWNILALACPTPSQPVLEPPPIGRKLVYILLTVLLLVQPLEARLIYRVLTRRAHTMTHFQAEHLDALQGKLGIALDVGYIGYFSKAQICDLAGLVNGRAAARLTIRDRAAICAARHPDFLFLSQGQVVFLSNYMSFTGWQVCGQFDLTNLNTPDSHYLILPDSTAAQTCKAATGETPYPATQLLPATVASSASPPQPSQ